jgi:hypothetical protein
LGDLANFLGYAARTDELKPLFATLAKVSVNTVIRGPVCTETEGRRRLLRILEQGTVTRKGNASCETRCPPRGRDGWGQLRFEV